MIKKLVTTILITICIVGLIPTNASATPQMVTAGWFKSWHGSLNWGVHHWKYYEDNGKGCQSAKGWKYIDGYWYYFNPGTAETIKSGDGFVGGDMQTGWIKDNGKWYFCYYNGRMAHDCFIDHWHLGSDGTWDGKVDDESLKQYNSRTFYGLCMADEEQTDTLCTNNGLKYGHKITKKQLERFKQEKKVCEGSLFTQSAQGDGSNKNETKLQYLVCYNPWEEYEPLKDLLSPNKVYVDSLLEEGYEVTAKQFEKFKAENRLGQVPYTESSPSGQTRQSQAYYLLW